jgi:hypothetical protein
VVVEERDQARGERFQRRVTLALRFVFGQLIGLFACPKKTSALLGLHRAMRGSLPVVLLVISDGAGAHEGFATI